MSETLQSKLADARRRWQSIKAVAGAAWAFSILVGICLVSFHVDRLVVLTTPGRWAWLVTLVAAALLSVIAFVLRPVRRPLPDTAVATEIERTYPALRERLLSTVELAHAGAAAGASGALVHALSVETERVALPLNFRHAMPAGLARRPLQVACAAGFLFAGHALVMPGALNTWLKRILFPAADIPIYARTLVWVTPEQGVVPRGEEVTLGVKTAGRLPDSATIHYRFDGGAWSRVTLVKPAPIAEPDSRRFELKLPDAQQNITFYATANDGHSNPHVIRVEDRPAVLSVRVALRFPDYTRRAPEIVTATAGNIVAPVGTQAQILATASKPLREAVLMEAGKPRGPWQVQGETVRGSLTVRHDETYGLLLKDNNGFEALNPPQYTVRAQPDKTPEVQVSRPGADIERTPTGTVNLRVSASDDYGIESMGLAYHAPGRNGSLPLPGGGSRQVATGGAWNLTSLRLKPGDTVVYEATARDGDTISGPHTGRSASYRVHILSVAEMRERIDAQRAQEQEALRQLVQRQREAQTQLEQARRTPNQTDRMAQAETAQRNVAQEAADLARRMQQTTEQIRDNRLGTEAEARRRDETQAAVQQLSQKAMPAAADTIQRAQSRPAERTQALGEASKQEQSIREELERLAQQSSPAMDLNRLAAEAERLAQEQQRLEEQSNLQQALADNNPAGVDRAKMQHLAKQQAALREQTQALLEQAKRTAEETAQRGLTTAQDVQQASERAQRAGIPQKQTSAQSSLQANKPGEAAPPQEQAAQALRDLANRLDEAGQKESDLERQKRADRLSQAAEKLVDLANKQMNVARQADRGVSQENARKLAGQQRDIERQAAALKPQLDGAGKAQQMTGQAQENMKASAGELDKNSPRSAVSPAAQAAQQLRQAAMEAMEAERSARQEQAARALQQKAQQLARDQRAVESQTRKLESQRNQGPLNPDQQKRAQEVAKKQEKLTQRGRDLVLDADNQSFKWAFNEAVRRMDSANRALQQQNTGQDTQRNQENAAQVLERISRALDQQAQASRQQQQAGQQQQQQGSGEQQAAQASADLELAREMEGQIRQETGSLDQRRERNPGRNLTADQQRELDDLQQAQRETRSIAQRAAQQLRSIPDAQQLVQRATEEMSDVEDQLQQRQTGQRTQGTQERIVGQLDTAMRQVRQAMREQRQQMAQQGKKPGQQGQKGQQMAQKQGGNQPAPRTFAPLSGVQNGLLGKVDPRGRGFGALSPRDQQLLREGKQEKVPAEYRELVNQYYKALSEKAR